MKRKIPNILVVDDEPEVGNFFDYLLNEDKGFIVTLAHTGEEGLEKAKHDIFNLVLIDLKLPDMKGIELLKQIKTQQPQCQIVLMTGYSTIESAVEAIKYGAYDYLEKPFDDLDKLEGVIDGALDLQSDTSQDEDELIHQSAQDFGIYYANESPMHQLIKMARKIAPKNITVLITGETGTGKELLARYIHFCSKRADYPFFAVNCGAFTETLLESELFGHEKGAFTGAQQIRKGIFELAHGGTLFLDEISEASPSTQVKLLRILESGEFRRIGSETHQWADVRLIAATNKDLSQLVEKGEFRKDLYYRLDVITLNLPALRQRSVDIPHLIDAFLTEQCQWSEGLSESTDDIAVYGNRGRNIQQNADGVTININSLAVEILKHYAWPGNIRELANVISRALALQENGEITVEHLPAKISGGFPGNLTDDSSTSLDTESLQRDGTAKTDWSSVIEWWSDLLPDLLLQQDIEKLDINELKNLLEDAQVEILRKIVCEFKHNKGLNNTETAERLGTTPRALRYLLREKNSESSINLSNKC